MGIVYAIRCRETGEVYVGSTKLTLNKRMSVHYSHNCVSKQIMERGNYIVEILEEVEDVEQLRWRELHYVDTLDKCINIRKPIVSENYKSEYNKQYAKDNADVIKARHNHWSSEKITCECGRQVRRGDISSHRKTLIHLNLIP
jgi:hypothetical protein